MVKPLIRPFTTDDYGSVAAVRNSVYPDFPIAAEEIRFDDEHDDPKCVRRRWVAEVGGQVVGIADLGQHHRMYHPRKFLLDLVVRPESQGRGIGAALYDQLLTALAPFDPIALRFGDVGADMVRGIRFIQDRGFVEELRTWESRLDISAFDPTLYSDAVKRVAAQGVTIESVTSLSGDPERNRKLFDLDEALAVDVPRPDPIVAGSFEHFVERIFNEPNLLPNAYFVALLNGQYIGQTNLWRRMENNDLNVGFTGVRREYRRRGIALALKLPAIAWARKNGFGVMKTWNESSNEGMLAINERLGFAKQSPWIGFIKVLSSEDSVADYPG
jgi:GNAT superfamily N-acetyltransferase